MKADSCEYQEPGRPGRKKIVFYTVSVHIGITVINSQYATSLYICMHLARIRFLTSLSILELEEICTGFGRETIRFHIVESIIHSLFLHIDTTANNVLNR